MHVFVEEGKGKGGGGGMRDKPDMEPLTLLCILLSKLGTLNTVNTTILTDCILDGVSAGVIGWEDEGEDVLLHIYIYKSS